MPPALLLAALFQTAAPPPDSAAVVVPGARHAAGRVHRFLLGDTHRALWTTAIRAPVLDLERHAGGLTPYERGGSRQTRSLRFRAGDGRTLVFRALEKDPTQTWPEILRESPARSFAEDQISALLPGGPLAVSVLEDAAGLLHARPALFVLPDHPRLGEWRAEFAGSVGLLEERVRGTGTAVEAALGASEVIDTETLFAKLADGGHGVDGPAFLAARLLDLVVGDWDRHADQWSWARFDVPAPRTWRPVPRDRDWALSRLDGPLYGLLRLYMPKYQTFDARYGSIYGLTLSAEPLDRRLLVWLDRAAWDSVTADLVRRLDDRAIDSAVGALPAEFAPASRAELARALRQRRDHLPGAAAAFYRQLSGDVDLHGSARAERFTVRREPDGGLVVTLESRDHAGPPLHRRFHPDETGEVRLYPGGGADSIAVTGAGPGRIRLRVVEGEPPPPDPLRMPRDWGHRWSAAPWFELSPEVGLVLGGGPVRYGYGFGRQPFASRIALRVAGATGRGGLNAELDADVRFRRPGLRLLVRAGVLDLDVVRYFGAGNQTGRTEPDDYYRVVQRDLFLEPALEWRLGPAGRLAAGGFVRSSRTDLDQASLLAAERPYGAGSFRAAGLSLRWTVDSRDLPAYPTRGARLDAVVRGVPDLLDARSGFATARLEGSTYLTAAGWPARPTLALRAGGSRVFGTAPYFEGASIGGRTTVRGLSSRRFLGDAAAWGGLELRAALGGFTLLLPGEWGLFGLGDVGRVWREGERSRRWHGAGGGGLWFAFLDRRSTMSVTVARSEEKTRLYVRAGMHY